ncbi:uncharacterized protein LOC128884076 [Hylaeus volcanicus]|uniref:uncharacterized protein LOC128884076 n=1 Tax=Hylaeus volcanicus TaxID=313075 RepID=UPI0023B7CB19|nr:uncharacterized protein LOC128884076 [Hylaeus volcanicus]
MAPICDPNAAFFGFMGVTCAVVFCNLGSAYGTAKAGVGIASMGVMRPDLVMKSTIPVIMAALLGIYGLVMGNFIKTKIVSNVDAYSFHLAYSHLAAGLTVGLSSLASGLAIGIVGDAGVRAIAQQPRLFVGVLLMLIFAEALGLYGFIIAVLITGEDKHSTCTA